MILSDFLNRHAGETAWLFGKGPSLSTFDFKTAGPLRVAINDVAAHVPDVRYCFADDGVKRWANVYGAGQVLFQPIRCMGEYDSRRAGAVRCEVVTFADGRADERILLDREALADGLTYRRGTLGSALQILHVMGVATVHMVGIDGGRSHAPGYEWKTELRQHHGAEYSAIRSAAIEAAHVMGITLKFHNQNHTMETNGRVSVRMSRNCFVQSIPYSSGDIESFSPRIASELVSIRCAEYHKDQHPIERETAAMPAAETADIRTPRKYTRKPTQ